MTSKETVRVTVGKVSLELPVELVRREGTPVDSTAGVFQSRQLNVIVDQGPFVNRLDSDIGRSGYRESAYDIGGTKGRKVFFRDDDGRTYTVAVHVPAPEYVTVVVRADATVPEEIPERILHSIQLVN